MMKSKLLSCVFGLGLVAGATGAMAGTLDDVKAKGFVQCGVSQGLPGFSNPDSAEQLDRHGRRFLPCGRRGDLQ